MSLQLRDTSHYRQDNSVPRGKGQGQRYLADRTFHWGMVDRHPPQIFYPYLDYRCLLDRVLELKLTLRNSTLLGILGRRLSQLGRNFLAGKV